MLESRFSNPEYNNVTANRSSILSYRSLKKDFIVGSGSEQNKTLFLMQTNNNDIFTFIKALIDHSRYQNKSKLILLDQPYT